VWSFGCVLTHMATGRAPYSQLGRMRIIEVLKIIGEGATAADATVTDATPLPIRKLITSCVTRTATDRPSFDDITSILSSREVTTTIYPAGTQREGADTDRIDPRPIGRLKHGVPSRVQLRWGAARDAVQAGAFKATKGGAAASGSVAPAQAGGVGGHRIDVTGLEAALAETPAAPTRSGGGPPTFASNNYTLRPASAAAGSDSSQIYRQPDVSDQTLGDMFKSVGLSLQSFTANLSWNSPASQAALAASAESTTAESTTAESTTAVAAESTAHGSGDPQAEEKVQYV